MAYYGGGGDFLMGHTGSGGMTSSLSVGTYGSATIRRLKMFPLSPAIVDGSGIKSTPQMDPRFHNTLINREQTQVLIRDQGVSRSRPVNTRAQIDAMLQQFS